MILNMGTTGAVRLAEADEEGSVIPDGESWIMRFKEMSRCCANSPNNRTVVVVVASRCIHE